MTKLEALRELLAKVEAGTLEYNDCCEMALEFLGFHGRAFEAYHGSFDGAEALHNAVLPGWTLNQLNEQRHPDKGMLPTGKWIVLLFAAKPGRFEHSQGEADTPARAWLISILKALIAEDAFTAIRASNSEGEG